MRYRHAITTVWLLAAMLLLTSGLASGQQPTREQKVREDRRRVEAEGFWIYNDLQKGFAEARRTGKPLLVVMRCIPCEECVKLDDELVDQHPEIQPLLKEFVCVRQVSTNGLDLSTFQYDTDQSFAVFLLNADGTIYGRFGTRSHRTEWFGDVSLPGMAEALRGALELHAEYPGNKEALAGKRGPKPLFPTPEQYPSLSEKYTATLNYSGNVVQSCIHCHQIGDAQREYYRERKEAIPESVLFPYPHPKSIGLILDPQHRATVKKVEPDSLAAQAGFQAGDRLTHLNGQPLLSMADVQWVLHQADPAGDSLAADVQRGSEQLTLKLALPDGWRRSGDISWRVTSWGLRRMATGGLRMEPVTDQERSDLKIAPGQMALRITHVGQYGPHAAAKQAGFQKDDVIVAIGERTDLRSETDVLVYGVTERQAGEKVPVTVLRNGRRRTLQLPMQK